MLSLRLAKVRPAGTDQRHQQIATPDNFRLGGPKAETVDIQMITGVIPEFVSCAEDRARHRGVGG